MIDLGLEIYRTIGREADRMGVDAYAVGGVVRDYFLHRPCTDIDVVCISRAEVGSRRVEDSFSDLRPPTSDIPKIGIELANAVSAAVGGSKVSVFKTFGTASFRYTPDHKHLTESSEPDRIRIHSDSSVRDKDFSVREYELEFVGARRESYSHDSRKPIVENGTLEDDQRRRDFTVNALAVCLNADRYGELMDPFGGIQDLNEGILRTPLDPDVTFSDDPLRMMRAVRFASQLGFRIADDTFEAIGRNAKRIEIVSAERITVELNKIMLSPQPSLGLKLMQKCGLMQLILPEISALAGVETVDGHGHKDIFYHTMQVLDNLCLPASGGNPGDSGNDSPKDFQDSDGPNKSLKSEKNQEDLQDFQDFACYGVGLADKREIDRSLWLRWSALLHDVGKPGVKRYDAKQGWTFHGHEARGAHMVKRIFKRLRLPLGAEERYVEKLVMLHMRPIVLSEEEVTDSAVRRLLFEAGDDIDDLMLLCNADITSKNPEKVRKHKANFELVKRKLIELEERDRIRNFQPPVSGQDIMDTFGIGPCREIGTIKDAIKDAILDGQIPNDRDAAWQMMLRLAADLGLHPSKE
jgi:poly(A) polymerase